MTVLAVRSPKPEDEPLDDRTSVPERRKERTPLDARSPHLRPYAMSKNVLCAPRYRRLKCELLANLVRSQRGPHS